MLQIEGIVQQNTTRPHFTYADRVIKYLIHPELISSEVTKLSIAEQCLLVRDFMNRNQPEQYVRAEPIPRDSPLPAVTFTQKIINKNIEETKLNNISTPISPPSSPLIYPSSPQTQTQTQTQSPVQSAQNKLPLSCSKYLLKRKKPVHYLQSAGKIVVICNLALQDLETYIPHINLKKLIKYIITAGMNAPSTRPNQNKTKYILKSTLWKPIFQRWVINSLIDSGSSDVLGHSAKHITNIRRGADTIINVLTYYMRLTTNTKKKKKAQKQNELTKPSWECMENGPKMFTLKGESSDEDGDKSSQSDNDNKENDLCNKKKKAIAKYYDKWKSIYGEDVSHLTAFIIQKRCIEKYEICCDVARYYFINDNWKKAKKWFNRTNRWYLRVDQKNLNKQKGLKFDDMISNKRYKWKYISNIIRVLNVILQVNVNGNCKGSLYNNLYECIESIVDKNKNKNKNNENFNCNLFGLLLDICEDKTALDMLSVSLLNVWLNEMKYFCGQNENENVGYLQIFVMVYAMYIGDNKHTNNGIVDQKYFEFYVKLIDKMYQLVNDKHLFYALVLKNIDGMVYNSTVEYKMNLFEVLKNIDWIKKEDGNKLMNKHITQEHKSMDIDADVKEEENYDAYDKELCWSSKLMFVSDIQSMNTLLSQIIDNGDNNTYNMAINHIINRWYDSNSISSDMSDNNEWFEPLKNVLLSMVNKHNRNEIEFIKLLLNNDVNNISLKLNGLTSIPSFNGLYALFQCCFHKKNIKLINTLCNHLYSAIFSKQRECEKVVKNMNDKNEIYQAKYANIIYKNYHEKHLLLNLFIHQNSLINKINLFTFNKEKEKEKEKENKNDISQHVIVLHRYMNHLCKNIKFIKKEEKNSIIDPNDDYLYPIDSDSNIKLFLSDKTTKFLFDIFCNEICDDFLNILSPLIIGLIHCIYSKSQGVKYIKRSKFLFLSFKGNKYYEFILTNGMTSNIIFADNEFVLLIQKNMNKLLTFLYFVYLNIWNKKKYIDSILNISILHKCSDILLAKNNEHFAFKLLINETNCLYNYNKNQLTTHVSNEYGFIFLNEKIFSHFIYLACLNGKKIEAVLLWQLSTDINRIKYATNIIKKELSIKDLINHINDNEDMNIFECTWEPLIFCALKDKFSNQSKKIDNKLNQYLENLEMGTNPKLKANKLCDFILNNSFIS